MLLDPSAEVFVCWFVCFFIFVVLWPSSSAEVKGQGQFRNSSRRVAEMLSLRSADALATKLATAAAREPEGHFLVCFFCAGKRCVFVFLPRLTSLRQEVQQEQEEELCHGPAATDTF